MTIMQPVVGFTYEDYGAVSAERGGLSIVPGRNLEHRKVCFKERGELDLDHDLVDWQAREEHGS